MASQLSVSYGLQSHPIRSWYIGYYVHGDLDGKRVHEYTAGNSVLESQWYIMDNPATYQGSDRANVATLLKWARATALELATEWAAQYPSAQMSIGFDAYSRIKRKTK